MKAIPRTEASTAPALTPVRSGEANGLRVMVCKMAPASPSMAPTKIATSPRGNRKSQTIWR